MRHHRPSATRVHGHERDSTPQLATSLRLSQEAYPTACKVFSIFCVGRREADAGRRSSACLIPGACSGDTTGSTQRLSPTGTLEVATGKV